MDSLTGLYNRSEAAEEINRELSHHNGGALIVADIDNFRNINRRFGYRMGDRVLKEFARILQYMFGGTAIIGRLGSNVFAVFVRELKTKEAIGRKADQLRSRVEQLEIDSLKISIQSGTAVYQDYDRFASLLKRAAGELERVKCGHTAKNGNAEINRDMERIKADLSEEDSRKGAYCQSYDYFKNLCRFEQRVLERSHLNVYVILVTLTDARGDLVFFESREPLMAKLKEMIENNLRRGDAFTQYSSSQYIIMALSTDHGNVELIGERLREKFQYAEPDAALRYEIHSMEEKRKEVEANR